MQNFRTYQMAKDFYKQARSLRLPGAANDQFHRASLSIVLNLAEGSAKPTLRDRKKFYHIALGSLREVQALLDIIDEASLLQQADALGAHLYRLCKS